MPRHNDESGHQLWRGNDPLTGRDFGRSNQNFGGYGGWGNYDFSYSNTSLFSPSTKVKKIAISCLALEPYEVHAFSIVEIVLKAAPTHTRG